MNSSSVHHMFTFAPASISRISKSRKYANNKFTRSVCEQHYKDLTIVRPTPPTPPPHHYHSSSSPHQELRFHHPTGQTPSSPMSATSVSSTVTSSSSSSFSPTAFIDCTSTSSNGSYSSTQPRAEVSQVDVMNPGYSYTHNHHHHQKPKVQYQFVHYGQDEKQQMKWDHPVMEPVIQERKISSSGYASHWVITPSPPSFSSPSAMSNGIKDSFKLQQQLSATAAHAESSLSLRNRKRKTKPLLASPSSTDVPLQLPMSPSPSLSLSAQQKSIQSDFGPMANQQSTSNNMTISPTQLLTPIGGDSCCATVDVNNKVQSQHKPQDLSIIDAMYSVLQSSFSTRSQQTQEQQEQQQKEYEEKSYSTMGSKAPQTTTTTNSNNNSNRGRTVISINELLN